ncbi:hypothetical protein PAB09_01155 [Corynebacterium sp. SCR221107]|uniref:hypothetical protein n=1 Tax=Corynebacterium sp. SCR221107 TaxID=3017361 RepID=UPI0022EC3281|nr:hypothetical protein [Corynebacterium sp. SCR221107]WBT08990.1 hypothetical protein PAB09_01155 [Corynebacterium sp. SCR221107]
MSDRIYSATTIPDLARAVNRNGYTLSESLESAIREVFTDWFDEEDIDVETLASDIADAAWKQLAKTDITAYLRAEEEQ